MGAPCPGGTSRRQRYPKPGRRTAAERAWRQRLRSLLGNCSLDQLSAYLAEFGIDIVRRALPQQRSSPRPALPSSRLAAADGLVIRLGPGEEAERIWAVSHLLAHTIQWHTSRPRVIDASFRIGAHEARRISLRPLSALSPSAFKRAMMQETEAHLLTAAILHDCFALDANSVSYLSLAKLVSEVDWLAHLGVNYDPRRRIIELVLASYAGLIARSRLRPPAPNLALKRLSGRFQPYLWLQV